LSIHTIFLLVILGWLFLVTKGTAQDEVLSPSEAFKETEISPRSFNESDWKEITKDIDYTTTTNDKKNVDEDVGDEPGGHTSIWDFPSRKKDGAAGQIWNVIIKATFVLMLVILAVFIISSIIKGENIFKKQKKVPKGASFTIEEIEDKLAESDLEKFIREAEAAGKYPLAIRLFYLSIIKELSQKRIIRYKKNKTNHNYISKVDDTTFGSDFREATRLFERIWYGQSEFTQTDYQVIKPRFQKWINSCAQLPARASRLTSTAK